MFIKKMAPLANPISPAYGYRFSIPSDDDQAYEGAC